MATVISLWLSHTVSVTTPDGLRERKKRQMRQQISDVATRMFLDRGFDEVTVAEIAAAADVSEKTVFNYFPTKESLLLDREPAMREAIQAALGPGATVGSPIEAMLAVLDEDLNDLVDLWQSPDVPAGIGEFRQFLALSQSTASLRAAQQDMMNRLVQIAAEAIADRAGVDPSEPEPQITAQALIGLWRIQFQALRKAAESGVTDPVEIGRRTHAEVRRAARLVETGLWAFSMMVAGATTRAQLQAAAELADRQRRHVISAMKEARRAWAQAKREMKHEMRGEGHW